MDDFTNSSAEERMLKIDFTGLTHLTETRKWTMFLSILGFVFIGFMIFMAAVMAFADTANPYFNLPYFSLIPLLVIVVIYFFPIYYLFQFSRYSRMAINQRDTYYFSEAMKFLKLHYRFMGILAIIAVGFYIVAIIAMLIGGSLMKAFS